MGKAIPQQHPAVVLRARYVQLRTLLVVALIAVVGLAVAVVMVASDGDSVSATGAQPAEQDRGDDGHHMKWPVRGALPPQN